MEKFKDLHYTVSTRMSEATMKKNHGGGPVGSRIEALAEAMKWLADASFGFTQERIFKKKMEEIYPHIIRNMKDYSGILIIAQYQQWASPNAAGSNPPELISLKIGPAASNRKSAIRKFVLMEREPNLKQAPSPGMVYGPVKFVWITKIPSNEKPEKQNIKKQEKQYWKAAP